VTAPLVPATTPLPDTIDALDATGRTAREAYRRDRTLR
jgi:hypothetical protein